MDQTATTGASAPASPTEASAPDAKASQAQGAVKESITPATAGKSPESIEDELEEISLGSIKSRVPKQFAKTVKELEKAFHSKSQQSVGLEKQLKQFFEQAKSNPDYFFEQLGLNANEYVQSKMAKYLEEQAMSPEERARVEKERILAEREARVKEKEDREEKERLTKEEQAESTSIRRELMGALQKSGLPEQDLSQEELAYLAARTVATMQSAQDQGLDWTWDDCVAKVEKDYWTTLGATASKLTPEQMEERFGRENLVKWREWEVSRVTGSASKKPKTSDKRPAEAASEKKKVARSENDFFNAFDAL